MVTITPYGGVGEIGGNIILLEEDDNRILIDMGKNFTAESDYFSEFLQPRKAHGLADFLRLGLLPDLDGLYRRDYLHHIDREPADEPLVDALFLSHGHIDHVGYVHFLRSDIPIYCTPTTKAVMATRQEADAHGFNDYVEKVKSFYLRENSSGGISRLRKNDGQYDSVDIEPIEEREIHTMTDSDTESVGPFDVTCVRVNHSLPGAAGFHIETPTSRLAYTGDLRLHGYNSEKTEAFIERTKEFEPDALLSEGTKIGRDEPPRETEVRDNLSQYLAEEDDAAFINFPMFDLERMYSVLQAAQENDRTLAIRTKQAYFLKILEDRDLLPWDALALSNDAIQVIAPKKSWGMMMHKFRAPSGEWKRLDEINMEDEDRWKLIRADYQSWERNFIERDDTVPAKDIRDDLSNYLVYLDYYRLKDLIDFDPEQGSYLWSRTEPFTAGMELDQKRVHHWLNKFNLQMKKAHASGHIGESELADMIHTISPKSVVPIHTEDPEWFQRFAMDIKEVEYGVPIQVEQRQEVTA